jgi:aminoglycoside/choline kinase family phosphotransferase
VALIPLTTACDLVRETLAQYLPDPTANLTALNDSGASQAGFVLRVTPAAGGSLIAKVSAEPSRLAAQFRRLTATHPRMKTGLLRVPEPLFHDAARGVMLMEDGWGQQAETLWRKGGADALAAMQVAGGWLARFHALSARKAPFDPTPHLNWLERALLAQAEGHRAIPDFAALDSHLPRLHHLATVARDKAALRCITHRDFHLRNIVIRPSGRVYGLDFENEKLDDALRDPLFFLTDALIRSPSGDDFPAAVAAFWQGYGAAPASPEVQRFFHLFQALSAWAALDESITPLGPNRRHRLHVMQRLADAEIDGIGLPQLQSALILWSR